MVKIHFYTAIVRFLFLSPSIHTPNTSIAYVLLLGSEYNSTRNAEAYPGCMSSYTCKALCMAATVVSCYTHTHTQS